MKMTEEAYAAHQKRVKGALAGENRAARSERIAGTRNQRKYKNEPTWVDGIRFDSKKEAARYQELKLQERAEVILGLKHHVPYSLTVNGMSVADYEADFVYLVKESDVRVVEDCKGVRTPVYKLKKKLMKAIYGIEIRET